MATHYLKLIQGITTTEIKAKFAAFELLYGSSTMLIKGDLPSLYKNQILPVFGVDGEIVKVGRKTLTVKPRFRLPEEQDYVIPLEFLYVQRPALTPEIMFITDV
jgi:hypothetical protein